MIRTEFTETRRTARFLTDESGAVTVDMMPLMAVVVGLGLAMMGMVSTGVQGQSEQLAASMTLVTEAELERFGSLASLEASRQLGTTSEGTYGARGGDDPSGIVRISGRVGRAR